MHGARRQDRRTGNSCRPVVFSLNFLDHGLRTFTIRTNVSLLSVKVLLLALPMYAVINK